jgi:prepilin-type N-terminal cleavage/methylation domain-containing protein
VAAAESFLIVFNRLVPIFQISILGEPHGSPKLFPRGAVESFRASPQRRTKSARRANQNQSARMKNKFRNGFTLIEIMVVIGIIGVIAAIAIPSLQSATKKAGDRACALNRKNINGAKFAWALENRKPPEAVPSDEELFGEDRYIDHKPDCPAGGDYALNAAREKCTCSVPRHAN